MRLILVGSLPQIRINILFCAGILSIGLIHLSYVDCEIVDPSDIWAKYRPVAMTESWSLVTGRPSAGDSDLIAAPPIPTTYEARPVAIEPTPIPTAIKPAPIPPEIYPDVVEPAPVTINNIPPDIQSVDSWQGGNVKDTVFSLDSWSSPKMTKLITQHEPTFLANTVIKPEMTSKNIAGETTLARYRVIVPIFIPAIRRKVPTTKKPEVKFVREQITEMVPVKNMVPHVKEVIKAEVVPQQLITDYVEKDRNLVYARNGDYKGPGERLLTSEVKNIS
jgi:hypothetical protein